MTEHPGWIKRHVLYPERYTWYVLVSALDVMGTVTVLIHLGAREVNTFAQRSIDLFGTWGLIGLKFLSVALVVSICEYVGRRHERAGRTLATAAIVLSLIPVGSAVAQIGALWVGGELEWMDWPPEAP